MASNGLDISKSLDSKSSGTKLADGMDDESKKIDGDMLEMIQSSDVVEARTITDVSTEDKVSARRKRRHQGHGGHQRLRGKKANLLDAENKPTASPPRASSADETTNLITTEKENTPMAAPPTATNLITTKKTTTVSGQQRFRIFFQFKWEKKYKKQNLIDMREEVPVRLRLLDEMKAFRGNVDYGLNFYDGFSVVKNHFKFRGIAHNVDNLEFCPFGNLEVPFEGSGVKAGGGVEVMFPLTRSFPPMFKAETTIQQVLMKIGYNIIGGYPFAWGWQSRNERKGDGWVSVWGVPMQIGTLQRLHENTVDSDDVFEVVEVKAKSGASPKLVKQLLG